MEGWTLPTCDLMSCTTYYIITQPFTTQSTFLHSTVHLLRFLRSPVVQLCASQPILVCNIKGANATFLCESLPNFPVCFGNALNDATAFELAC